MQTKHRFILTETGNQLDRNFHVYECEKCLQHVKIEKKFMTYLLLHKPTLPFAVKALRVVPCNPVRHAVCILVPEVPMCEACNKQSVMAPGSDGLNGALCTRCYYDL